MPVHALPSRWSVPLVLAGALAAVPAAAQQRVTQARHVAAGATIRVFTATGSVRVVGWEHDSVEMTAQIPGGAGRPFLVGNDSTVKLGVDGPAGATDAAAGSVIEVRVPRGASVAVNTRGASMDVVDVIGTVDLSSATGGIRLSGAPRRVRAESIDGNIELDVTTQHVEAKSAGGWIVLRGESAEADLATVSGRILAGGSHMRSVRLSSVTGDIRFVGGLAAGGSLEVLDHAGDVRLRVPSDLSATFDVTTVEGRIDNRASAARPARDGAEGGAHLRFSVGRGSGAGAAKVTVTTFKGSVELVTP